jgi:thiol-disulfide isomerase/thioredoxin
VKKSILLFVILILLCSTLPAQTTEGITPAELETLRVTIFTEPEYFPLTGLTTLAGIPYNPAGLKGSYVLLNLGASWCPFCGKEKPTINVLNGKNTIEGLAILTIFLGEEVATVKEYLDNNNYTFPAAVDVKNVLREKYSPRLPTSYILDKEGKILARVNGNKEWDSAEMQGVLRYVIGVEKK